MRNAWNVVVVSVRNASVVIEVKPRRTGYATAAPRIWTWTAFPEASRHRATCGGTYCSCQRKEQEYCTPARLRWVTVSRRGDEASVVRGLIGWCMDVYNFDFAVPWLTGQGARQVHGGSRWLLHVQLQFGWGEWASINKGHKTDGLLVESMNREMFAFSLKLTATSILNGEYIIPYHWNNLEIRKFHEIFVTVKKYFRILAKAQMIARIWKTSVSWCFETVQTVLKPVGTTVVLQSIWEFDKNLKECSSPRKSKIEFEFWWNVNK